MILAHKNKDGFIYSYFEYDIVDKKGTTTNYGEYMYVRDIWVHPSYKGANEISKFIKEAELSDYTINVQKVYWLRTKWKNGVKISQRISKAFSRKVCLLHKEE